MSKTALRPASMVMRLDRMGASFPTRLSFMRRLIRLLSAEKATVREEVFDINPMGYGHAVHSVPFGGHTYSLVTFSTPLEPENRTDRVIAEAWDMTFVLFDGIPSAADITRLQANTPLQEAGRFSEKELVLCRANKSVRMFEHVVEALSNGQQPDRAEVRKIGYLARTTAVYGNGKFGIADRSDFAGRPHMSAPFVAEMLAVWLVRGFTHRLVEHVAKHRNPQSFTPLDPAIKRHLGIGNATGLGMAPFLVSHPGLIHNWVAAREAALAQALDIKSFSTAEQSRALKLYHRAINHLADWNVADTVQQPRIETLRRELETFGEILPDALAKDAPLLKLQAALADQSLEAQEWFTAYALEIAGARIDAFADQMAEDGVAYFRPDQDLASFRADLETHLDWALKIDYATEQSRRKFWYVSEEKLEPRIGDRFAEDGAELESPLDIAVKLQTLSADLAGSKAANLGAFLADHPAHRFAARRVQIAANRPYSELQDNLLAAEMRPIDMLRFKLAFFGANKFDPKSDLWTRITMYQGAPLWEEIDREDADDWWLPVLAEETT